MRAREIEVRSPRPRLRDIARHSCQQSSSSGSSRCTPFRQETSGKILTETLREILDFIKRHTTQNKTGTKETGIPPVLQPAGKIIPPSKESISQELEYAVDKQTACGNRDVEPEAQVPDRHRVVFSIPEEPQKAANLEKGEITSLVSELFGEKQGSTGNSEWDPIILASTKSETCLGLKEELRQRLLSKYELKADLLSLGPPKINNELKAAIGKQQSLLKRYKYQVNRLAERFHLMVDLQFCLSLARQAYIKPYLTLVGKLVADSSKVDD